MSLQAPDGGGFTTPRKRKSKQVETKSEKEIRAHCGLTIFENHIWSTYLALCGRVSGAVNLAAGLWSLRIKRNQWRLVVRPRPRGQAHSHAPAREDAGAPLVAFISQRPLTHGMFSEYIRAASATADFNRR